MAAAHHFAALPGHTKEIDAKFVKEEFKTWNPFKKKYIEFVVYDRIVFFFKLKDKEYYDKHIQRITDFVSRKI